MREQQILKAVLLLRKYNRSQTKEEQMAEVRKWFETGLFSDKKLQEWIEALQEPQEAHDWDEPTYCNEKEYYTPSCTAGDYGPSNPWDAPGMSICDFI